MHNDIVIFAGPTISKEDCSLLLDAHILPPAKQGDIYQAWLENKPKAMALIDGNFENTASPWHKEILYILSLGIKFYGSSSMGALRAAELHTFGMIGIGEIFEAYKAEDLEDDDEVAVLHGPPESSYKNLSEAMVNIRNTLELAYIEKVLPRPCYDYLIDIAKNTFYKDRTYNKLLKDLSEHKQWSIIHDRLKDWLSTNCIDQKRLDAITMIKRIKKDYLAGFTPNIVEFHFENTNVWKKMQEKIHEGDRSGLR